MDTLDPSPVAVVGGLVALVVLFVIREVAAGAFREMGKDLWSRLKRCNPGRCRRSDGGPLHRGPRP